jgi:hypothetical protein
MTWDDWSDKEIGFALTTLINDVNGWSLSEDGSVFYHCGIDGSGYFSVEVIDINNPADMWPVIQEKRISIYPSEGPDFMPWQAGCKSIMVTDKRPLRAAAIVLLMMKGVKPDDRI